MFGQRLLIRSAPFSGPGNIIVVGCTLSPATQRVPCVALAAFLLAAPLRVRG